MEIENAKHGNVCVKGRFIERFGKKIYNLSSSMYWEQLDDSNFNLFMSEDTTDFDVL